MVVVRELGHVAELVESGHQASEHLADVGSLLHRDDSELVFFIYPDKEGLVDVVEDASVLRPFAVEAAGVKEAVSFLEQEMVSDQLVSLVFGHGRKWVVGALQLSIESLDGLQDLAFDIASLLVTASRSERETVEVPSNSDPSANNHFRLVLWEIGSIELNGRVFGLVDIRGFVAVVLFDDRVEQVLEFIIRIMRPSIHSNSRIHILAARKDRVLEHEAILVCLITVLAPDVLGQPLRKQRGGARWEYWESTQFLAGR